MTAGPPITTATTADDLEDLFPPAFRAAAGRLTLAVRSAPAHPSGGHHLSRRPGVSLEFRDHQPYAPGDDLRRVDWAVFARTRHLFVRRSERPTAVPVTLLVDGSRSMRLESPARYDAAARAAAAVASAAVAAQNPVTLIITGRPPLPVARGRAGRFRLWSALVDGRGGDAGPSLAAALAAVPARPGVMLVASDFFEPAGADALVAALGRLPHRLVLARITRPSDADPDLPPGDADLTDCESGRQLRLTIDSAALARYRAAYATYFAALDGWADGRGARRVTIDASATDVVAPLAALFPAGTLAV